MKKLGLVCIAIVFMITLCLSVGVSQTYAWNIKLGWDANTETDLAGYKLYHSNTQGSGYNMESPDLTLNASDTEALVIVGDGFHCWILTAFDLAGNESEPSNEVCLTLPDDAIIYDHTAPIKPGGFMPIDIWE